MQLNRDGLVPIGEASPQARHHFTLADQVNQLVSASEADPDLGFMARRWCMNRNWPATNPTHRSITYQERTTMAELGRPKSCAVVS